MKQEDLTRPIEIYNDIFASMLVGFNNIFPENECTKQDIREKSIFLSDKSYWCFSVDVRFNDQGRIIKASPYVWKDKGLLYYGWMNETNYIACAYNTIHPLDDEFIVAWLVIE